MGQQFDLFFSVFLVSYLLKKQGPVEWGVGVDVDTWKRTTLLRYIPPNPPYIYEQEEENIK